MEEQDDLLRHERQRARWLSRLDELARYLHTARAALAGGDFNHALLMFTHIDEEIAGLRHLLLPFAERRLEDGP